MTAAEAVDWRDRAWCVGKPPECWESRQIHTPQAAEKLCAPCPVQKQCAAWAAGEAALCGVVVAGVALPEDPVGSSYEDARRIMARRHGVRYQRWCLECRREIAGEVKRGAKGMCGGCYHRQWLESRKTS